MPKLSPKFTYANVAATLALVFSMTGGALAANHYLVNSSKQINPKVLRAAEGSKGPQGAPPEKPDPRVPPAPPDRRGPRRDRTDRKAGQCRADR